MAYNNFPIGYQPYYPQNQTSNSGMIWVQGEAGAKSYMVAPNTTVQLWDSEKQTIYLKSADASGMPSIKTLDYTVRQATESSTAPLTAPESDFITRGEVVTIREDIDALRSELDALRKGNRNAKQHNANDKSA